MSKPVRHLLAGALTAPLLILAACGSAHHPVADPPSPPTSASASATPPRHETPEAFIRRFYEAERVMENSGAALAYERLIMRCHSCRALLREVKRFYRNGGFVRWGGFSIHSIRTYSSKVDSRTYAVRGSAKPTTYKSSARATPAHLAGGPTTELITLKRRGNSWEVTSFAKLAER